MGTTSQRLCECGCGQPAPIAIKTRRKWGWVKGLPLRFVHGHHSRVLWRDTAWAAKYSQQIAENNRARAAKQMASPPPTTSTRTSHGRARRKLPLRPCAWAHIGGCLGRIDCAHIDGDPFNNDPSNLRNLCRSHHFLLDRGRIDPTCPMMPTFYVDRSGKRRYAKVA